MTDRENVISLAKRTGYERMPISFGMTPECNKKFQEYCERTGYICPEPSMVSIPWSDIQVPREQDFWRQFYDYSFKEGTTFDYYGVAAEPGSEACFHMTKMYHPLENATTLKELQDYPFPKFVSEPSGKQIDAVKKAHEAGKFAMGDMQCTIWETAWYARSMESLMMDMLAEPEMANFMLDTVMENAIRNATNFVKAGVDGLFLGDDIGMQHTIMMSLDLYREYIKPRLKRVIDEARAINPDIVVFYLL